MPNNKSIYIPDSKYPRIVIVGAGFAGIYLAKALKKAPFQVVLLDKNNFHQFQPLFYQVATSGLEPDSIVFPVRKIFRGFRNFVFRMASVDRIGRQEKVLYTDIGTLSYNYLVLATGSTNNFYGLKDVELQGIGLKSIRDSLDIRSNILQNIEKAVQAQDHKTRIKNTTIVIVGGGPAGVEMAGAIAEFKKYIFDKDYPELTGFPIQIHLVEAGSRLLAAMTEKSSQATLKDLKKLGVEVHLGTAVTSYDSGLVHLSNDQEIAAASLVWTAGVKGQFPAGIDEKHIVKGNRIAVDQFNQIIGYQDLFAVGDVAFMKTASYPDGHPMVAPTAIQQATHLAQNFIREKTNWKPFVYFDKGSLATIGKKRAVADLGKFHFRGFFAWLIWSTVHLLSISGFKNKLRVGLNWMNSYFSYDKGNRLIIRRYRPTIKKV